MNWIESNAVVLFYDGCLRNRKRLCVELCIADSPDREQTEREILLKGYAL